MAVPVETPCGPVKTTGTKDVYAPCLCVAVTYADRQPFCTRSSGQAKPSPINRESQPSQLSPGGGLVRTVYRWRGFSRLNAEYSITTYGGRTNGAQLEVEPHGVPPYPSHCQLRTGLDLVDYLQDDALSWWGQDRMTSASKLGH